MPENQDRRAAFSTRAAELAVAVLFMLFAAVVMADSLRLGARWAADGPQAGYFPFYLGVIIAACALITFVLGLRLRGERNRAFVEVGQLRLVLTVLVPSAIYVALVGWLGIYVCAVLYIAFFMRVLGRYAWWKVAAVALGTSVTFFLVFERWFLVPLPKGPVETWLGLN